MKTIYKLFIPLVLWGFASSPLFAQGTDASIIGNIENYEDSSVPGATVLVRNESTGFEAITVSNQNGEYAFRQLPLGGPYTIKVSFVGFEDQLKSDIMLSLGDRVEVDFNMSESVDELETVVISGDGFKSRDNRLGKATSITANEVQQLPSANRNFNNLIQLSPLVGSGDALAGMDSRNNAVTIDGVNAKEPSFGGQGSAPYTISLEALREFEVVTNSYDVTEGRQAAGAIKAVTKSGTNEFHGSVFTYFWDARLAADQNLREQDVLGDTKKQRGFSLGGPIIKDKLHFFVAYDGERFDEQYSLWTQSTEEGIVGNNEGQFAYKADLDRAIDILQESYGVSDQRQYGFFQRTKKLDTWFGKIDWQINNRHKLTARTILTDFIQPNNTNSDIGRFGIYDAGYDFVDKGSNTLVSLRSQFSTSVFNEFKLGYYFNERGNRINTGEHPQLWIRLPLVEGREQQATLVGRYNRWTPELQINDVYSIINDTYINKGRFDFVIGTQNTITNSSGIYTHDTKGRFDFYSLDALEALEPDRYRRKHTNPGQQLKDPVATDLYELSAYAQATTDIMPNLRASLGLRYDVAIFSTAPDYNPTLETELGYRNDKAPIDANNVQPRLNLNYDVNGDGRTIINAGAGWFLGQAVTRPYIYALIDNGIRFTGVDVEKGQLDESGNEVVLPTPNYQEYDENYDEIPGDGLTVEDLYPSSESAAQVVRFVDKDLQLPMTFKTNISIHHYFTNWLRVGVSGYYNKTSDLLVMENVNLSETPAFTLNGEGGREIYTPLDQMEEDEANFNAARRSDMFSQALMFTNGYETTFKALVFDAAINLPRGGSFYASYTRAESKGAERFRNEDDQRFVGASYFDNYAFINNGFSANDFRQKLLVNLTTPKVAGFTLGAFLNIVERGRFSAGIAQAEVMGTDIREQRGYASYIFDPNSPATAETQGEDFVNDLQYVFNNASPQAVAYLRENIGKYAQPNGGLMGWRSDLNLRITNEIPLYKDHKLLLNLDCFNALNLINPEWGGYRNIINEDLYAIESFDPSTQMYQYKVNTNYGQSRYEGSGFSLMLGAKYTF